MPIEYVNYTITDVNGVFWAKIDGKYPISLLESADCTFNGVLPMLYPMPPNATNINITVDNRDAAWRDYEGSEMHQTAIGNWAMIYCVISDVNESFLLKIHYEHPIEYVNGSHHIFLYDLNIAPYLSSQSPDSTAYFAFRFQTDSGEVHVYTALPDSIQAQWQIKNYTLRQESESTVVMVELHSRFGEELPGDLAVVFSGTQNSSANLLSNSNQSEQETNYLMWLVPVLIDVVLVAAVLFVKRKAVVSVFSSRKNATKSRTQVDSS